MTLPRPAAIIPPPGRRFYKTWPARRNLPVVTASLARYSASARHSGNGNPLNFRLNAVEHRTDAVSAVNTAVRSKADEKLLVLRFAAQNPQKTDLSVNWLSFKFTPVDELDVNHACDSSFTRENSSISHQLLRGPQTRPENWPDGRFVPSAGPMPKLIVAREDGPVLRYDLRDKAKVPSLFADAADPSVAAVSALKVGQTAPTGPFAFSLQSAAFSVEALDGGRRDESRRHLIATTSLEYSVE